MTDAQASGETSSPEAKKRTSSNQKHEISLLFLFCVSFSPSGSGSAFPTARMRIHQTKFNEDLDPQPIYVRTVTYRTFFYSKNQRAEKIIVILIPVSKKKNHRFEEEIEI